MLTLGKGCSLAACKDDYCYYDDDDDYDYDAADDEFTCSEMRTIALKQANSSNKRFASSSFLKVYRQLSLSNQLVCLAR